MKSLGISGAGLVLACLMLGTTDADAQPAGDRYSTVDVLIATVREQSDRKEPCGGFSSTRMGAVRYGVCVVSIPRTHITGKLERPGPAWWPSELGWIWRPGPGNAQKHVTILNADSAQLDNDAFMNRVKAASRDDPAGHQVLIYVHGFNNTFEDALYQAAQLAYDLQFTGSVIAFSWPSYEGIINTYVKAKMNAERAGKHLQSFLLALGKAQYVKDITIVAHSMGGQMTWRELAQMALDPSAVKKLTNVILAAPDMEGSQFERLTVEIVKAGIPSTIYASRLDKALDVSRDLNNALLGTKGEPRAGLLIAVDGLDVVDASGHELDIARHTYFATKTVLDDLRPLILNGKRAKDRATTLSPKRDEKSGVPYWVLTRK